jgi:plasmid maintenance system killer protein
LTFLADNVIIVYDSIIQMQGNPKALPPENIQKIPTGYSENRDEKIERDNLAYTHTNLQYRICFKWESGNAMDVEIVDYH